MARININQYIYTPATIFDLQGRCWYDEQDKGVPCRIKVGPRRFLTEQVHPEELAVTIWQGRDGTVTYLPNEPVETRVDEDGILTIDMVAFARSYFGKAQISFCDSQHWKWYKGQPWSNTFLTTAHGAALSHSVWLDINVTHSTLLFTPGTLNLCGHDVLSIYWETFCDELGAPSEAMRPITEALLSGPHTVSAEDFMNRLKGIDLLQEYGFNHLKIRTDRGDYDLGIGLGETLTVSLKGEGIVGSEYKPSRRNKVLQDIDLLLQLLQAADGEAVYAKLTELHQQGLLAKAK